MRVDNSSLEIVTYTELLKALYESLKKGHNIYSIKNGRLNIDAEALAVKLGEAYKEDLPNNILGSPNSMRMATVNFNNTTRSEFTKLLDQIKTLLGQRLEDTLKKENLTPEVFASKLLVDMKDLRGSRANDLPGFGFEFQPHKNLQKKRLTLYAQSQPSLTAKIDPLLRFARLKIQVNGLDSFDEQLVASLAETFTMERCLKDFGSQEKAEDANYELKELLQNQVDDRGSEFQLLKEFFRTETIGQLKKIASVRYLEFLDYQLENNRVTLSAQTSPYRPYLQSIARRINLLNQFMWEKAAEDGFYDVSFSDYAVNLRDAIARANAFEGLPIIPKVEGSLGETTSKDGSENQFVFGIKLKLNGKVSARPQIPTGEKNPVVMDSFNYHVNLFDPANEAYKVGIKGPGAQGFTEKFLMNLLVYYFVFTNFGNSNYDPSDDFEKKILPVLKSGTQEEKNQLLIKLAADLRGDINISQALKGLKKLCRELLRKQKQFVGQHYDLHLQIRRGILEKNLEKVLGRHSFFRGDLLSKNSKQALRYISIGDAALTAEALCKLDVQLSLDDVLFYPASDTPDKFDMSYVTENIKVLRLLLAPITELTTPVYKTYFEGQPAILIPYRLSEISNETLYNKEKAEYSWKKPENFIFRIVFSLLLLISLEEILSYCRHSPTMQSKDNHPEPLIFVPILRLHLNEVDKASPKELFVGELTRILAHLLGEKHLTETQGLNIRPLIRPAQQYLKELERAATSAKKPPLPQVPSGAVYKVRNSKTDLYSVLPRKFQFTGGTFDPKNLTNASGLKRLALLIVSQRESDSTWHDQNNYRLVTIFGQVVTIDRQEDGSIVVNNSRTFSHNTDTIRAYNNPTVLADLITNLYDEGYRHVLYIAHSPHTSTLNLSSKSDIAQRDYETTRPLFFMEKAVLKYLQGGRNDLIIYPIFFDMYAAVKLSETGVNSLYIQDTTELANLINDPSQRIITFFNLFNGIAVADQNSDGDDQEKYNHVMTYSTFWNLYDEVIKNQDIHLGLLYDKANIRPSLKDNILNFITLFHFSRWRKWGREANLKLNPYEDIIGDNSVGKKSIQPGFSSNAKFQLLSFLTEVRSIISR